MKAWERWWPLTGVLAAACCVYGTLLVLDQPQDSDPDAKIVAYFASHSHRVEGFVGFFVFLAGILSFVVFLAALRERLHGAEGEPGRLSTLAFGAGVASAAVWVVSMIIVRADTIAAGQSSRFRVDPNAYRLLADSAYVGWVAATILGSLVVWATSAVALRTSLLPRWFAWLGVAVGVGQLFALFFIPFVAWWIWVAVTSVLLVRRRVQATAPIAQPVT
jgi:hypothetical protein